MSSYNEIFEPLTERRAVSDKHSSFQFNSKGIKAHERVIITAFHVDALKSAQISLWKYQLNVWVSQYEWV